MAPQREWFDKDYYAALGISSDASDKDIQRAYRKLAKQYHPDANAGDAAAEERFKEVSAAHDVLGDPEKRKEYDQVREMVASGGGPGGYGGFGNFGGFEGAQFHFDDGGGLGDLLGNLFGGGGRGGRGRGRGRGGPVGPVRGEDLETELHLDFLDAVHGITTTVNLTSDAPCSRCGGTGAEPGTFPETCTTCGGSGAVAVDQGPFSFSEVCPTCSGRGQVIPHKCKKCRSTGVERRRREVKVRIPAGVKDGQRIRVKGRGGAGRNGGPPGDLYVVVHVREHAIFGRSGRANLTVNVPITFVEAALGAQVKVPTLDAPVTVKVPAGTQPGTTVRVRGRGITPAKGDPGDLMVTFEVVVPERLTADEHDAIEALSDKLTGNPRQHLGV
jgi:molecular chaperone DnaJ